LEFREEGIKNMLPRVEVESTDVKSVMYDEIGMRMEIEYIRSGPYTYFNVSPDLYYQFLTAPSKGRFVNLVLRKMPNIPYNQGSMGESDFED
jgi:hypothetical protein